MGKIKNSLVSLVVGAGLVFGAGAVDVARGGDSHYPVHTPESIRQEILFWSTYGQALETKNKAEEFEKRQKQILEQQRQIEYNQSQQQNNQGALEDGVGNGLGNIIKNFRGNYTLLIINTKDTEKIKETKDYIGGFGYVPYVEKITLSNSQFYRLKLGSFENRQQAKIFIDDLTQKGFEPLFIKK